MPYLVSFLLSLIRFKKYKMVWTKSGHIETKGDFLSGWCTHTKEHGGKFKNS